jgi:hypothetical protein
MSTVELPSGIEVEVIAGIYVRWISSERSTAYISSLPWISKWAIV